MDCGAFTAYDNKGAYATGDAKIEDKKTWSLLSDGKLGPTSVVIHAYDVACSRCGAELEPSPEAVKNHPCINDGSGYEQVHSFVFSRVDFVDVPAYPQAGLLELASQSEARKVPIELLAGFYVSQSPIIGDKNKVTEKEFEVKISALEQEKMELQKQVADLKKAQETNADQKQRFEALSAELNAVKAELKAKADQEHAGHVEQAYRARAEAGIAGEEKAEREMLAKQNDSILKMFTSDAVKVASKIQAQGSNQAPKTKYSAQTQTDLKAAIAQKRASLGFLPNENVEEKN